MKNGSLVKEIEWLLLIALATFGLHVLLFDFAFFTKESADIPLHDVYFVISPWKFFLSVSLIIAFCVFGLKALFAHFKNYWGNWVLIILNALLIILFKRLDSLWSFVESVFGITVIDNGGWTIYPPLSALPQETDNTVYYICMIILSLTLLFLLVRQRRIRAVE